MPVAIIPYTRYRFRPPETISKADFEIFKGMRLEELRCGLANRAEHERKDFVRKHPVEHLCTMIAFYTFVGSAACGVLLLAFLVIIDWAPPSILWEPVTAAFAISSVLIGLIFRSHVETYSSFKKFLATRRKFYFQLKRDVDNATCFENFAYRLYAKYVLDDETARLW